MSNYRYGKQTPLRYDEGPVSFGWIVSAGLVSWSAAAAKDLLISRCWSGVFLYPTGDLEDEELNREPIQLLDSAVLLTRAFPCDWDRDGVEDLLLTDRPGGVYTCRRNGSFPDLSVGQPEILRDAGSGLPFNIPHLNPTVGQSDVEGGYVDPDFYCYLFPLVYPRTDGDNGRHLLIGDSAGYLWWQEDSSAAELGTPAAYRGEAYRKPGPGIRWGIEYRQRFGTEYVRPRAKALDRNGEPLLLGEGSQSGRNYPGGWVKPVAVRNPESGNLDLVVLTGGGPPRLLHLRHLAFNDDGVPMFDEPVEIEISGRDLSGVGNHGVPVLDNADRPTRLLLPEISRIAVLDWSWGRAAAPQLTFQRRVGGRDARATCYTLGPLLHDRKGSRFVADFSLPPPATPANATGNPPLLNEFFFTRIGQTRDGREVRLGADRLLLHDQNGVFRMRAKTDVKAASTWGFHRLAQWRFGADQGQHLIACSDTGHLYLLIDDVFPRYRSVGPLVDQTGAVIEIHNRVIAGGLDMTGQGYEDLVVAGASYQMGIKSDPHPGGGVYLIRNLGPAGAEEQPLLAAPVPLHIEGLKVDDSMNHNFQLLTLDVDGDGRKELIIAFRSDGMAGRICIPSADGKYLVYTGRSLPKVGIHEALLDLDGDGRLEYVFSGGETGLGYYTPLLEVESPVSEADIGGRY